MTQQQVLIVEDEPKIAKILEDYLQAKGGYATRIIDRGDLALEAFRRAAEFGAGWDRDQAIKRIPAINIGSDKI